MPRLSNILGYFSSLELGNQLVMLFLFYYERFCFKNPKTCFKSKFVLKIFLYIIYINFFFCCFYYMLQYLFMLTRVCDFLCNIIILSLNMEWHL